MARRKGGHGWTHVKHSRNPVPRPPRPPRNPAAPSVPGAQPPLSVLARRNHQHILTYTLHQEVDITRYIIGLLTQTEAANFAMASRQLRNVLAEQAGGRGPPNINNLTNWTDGELHCREEMRGGRAIATLGWCGFQQGLQSCMGPFGAPFFNGRRSRNTTDFHRTHLCSHCHGITDPACEAEERLELLVHQTGMCTVCEKRWRQRHPMGWRTCICRFREEKWFCWFCRTDKQIQWWPIRNETLIRYEHAWRSRAGGLRSDPDRPAEEFPRCHCGGKHTNHAQRNVAMCLICEGIVVRATAVTGSTRRRSARVQEKYDEEDRKLPRTLMVRGE
ncbi:hypothetical protein MMC27_004841 [Xylographa pallens]|nr:hypothetical protein [Xylographa pallens]